MTVTIRHGDCREVLRTLADESVLAHRRCYDDAPLFADVFRGATA
jgi:hypothetical protein